MGTLWPAPKSISNVASSKSEHRNTRLPECREAKPTATVFAHCRDLSNAQWEILNTLIPEPIPRRNGRGRPWKDRRTVLNGILWVLRTGAPWADVPDRYPSLPNLSSPVSAMVRSGIMKGLLEALALDLKARGALDVREAFIDGSFAPAKKGALRLERQSAAKARKSWRLQTATACP
jgi:transposase